MALVIKKWYASEVPNEEGNYVHLVGREAGLFAWLLSVIGLDPTTEIQIKDKLIIFSAASLSGRSTRVIPMQSITSAYYGYEKPWKEALLIAVLLSPVFFIGLLLGPLYYFLNKTLAIGVVEASSWSGGFAFKRSVIEGQNIDEKQAYRVIEVVRKLIEKQTT
ncbi:hypothetical protein DBR47_07690 [Paucibacter sp. KBW04]|uniref:hypothetical protein n=1 Tax=Paucibacter sp. KBW04 TaxID=2153361 RepID=UPI000F5722F4|nr:hypothetical protein [Paucibacter sp. KBW04]RQO61114.1 hypothetical protein DBR47_07690 [Paucibacter sp. KBW04]